MNDNMNIDSNGDNMEDNVINNGQHFSSVTYGRDSETPTLPPRTSSRFGNPEYSDNDYEYDDLNAGEDNE